MCVIDGLNSFMVACCLKDIFSLILLLIHQLLTMSITICRSTMVDRDTDDELSDVEHEIMTIYVAIVADHIQTHYLKTPMCTSALSRKSYVQETLDGHPQTCYNTFRMAKHMFLHLCNELKRLHLLEEDTGIVSVQESIGVLLYILGHNADIRLTGNRFQHSLETIQRRLRRAFRAFHSLGCLIIRPDQEASKLPNHLRGNTKYYP